jgi:hypothetical protein
MILNWKQFAFHLTGSDLSALNGPQNIAEEELARVDSFAFFILSILVINFICFSLIANDVLTSLTQFMPYYVFVCLIVIPFGFFCTLILFVYMRFILQIGVDINGDSLFKMKIMLSRMPIWGVLLAFAFVAATPLQVRALSDDILINDALERWERLNVKILSIQLDSVNLDVVVQQSCVDDLIKPNIFFSIDQTLGKVEECKEMMAQWGLNGHNVTHSLKILNSIESELYASGLIARSQLAFSSAQGVSWLIILFMMLLYISPVFIRVISQKRAFEFVGFDIARLHLASHAGIELFAHEAHDERGKSVPLNRYWSVEDAKEYQFNRHGFDLISTSSELAKYKDAKKSEMGLG